MFPLEKITTKERIEELRKKEEGYLKYYVRALKEDIEKLERHLEGVDKGDFSIGQDAHALVSHAGFIQDCVNTIYAMRLIRGDFD